MRDHIGGSKSVPGGGCPAAVPLIVIPALFFCLSSSGLLAQTWSRTYGTDGRDEIYSAAPTTDGGLVLAGEIEDPSNRPEGIWVLRLDSSGDVIPELTISQTKKLIDEGVISGGMIPKVETCIHAVQNDVDAAVIIDGTVPHALLLEIFTDAGVGTLIRAG